MVKCETCAHECTLSDFVTFSNMCEHLYLDALASKQNTTEDTAQACFQE